MSRANRHASGLAPYGPNRHASGLAPYGPNRHASGLGPRLWSLALAALVPACGADGGAAERCAPLAFAPCAPLYAPTFTDIYSRRLSTTCSSGGGACHGASEGRGGRGGLTLDDADSAYQGLVDEGRVTPGDADCGDLVERLTTSDPGTLMPPGSPLPDSESCAIRQWISDGAKR